MSAARLAGALAALALVACTKVTRPPEPEPAKPEAPDSRRERGVPPRGEVSRVPASPDALLAPGAVKALQAALGDRGLLGAHAEGELDAATTAALRTFQEGEGLAATGFPDRETLERLGIDPATAYGRPGDAPDRR